MFSGERSRFLEKLNKWFSQFFHEEFRRVPSWVIDTWCDFPEFGSSGFMMNTRLEDVLACLGDGRDIRFSGAVAVWLTRYVEPFEVRLDVAMSCDCLIESGGDGSADRFEPLGYLEMWVENEGGSIKGAGLFYRILVNVFFPPPEWIDFIDLGKGVG